MDGVKIKQPYKDLLYPLSTVELDTLRADIKANGVLVPIAVDEEGNILDGHHRYSIDKNAPRRVVAGLSDPEKQAYVIRCNLNRRNISPDQRRELLQKQKAIAKQLREQDAKRWTQKEVAAVLGVTQKTVCEWMASDISNIPGYKANNPKQPPKPKPDARVKVNTDAKKAIAERVAAGETQAKVAADFGITQGAVSQVVKKATEIHSRDNDKARKTAHLKSQVFKTEAGDFREVLKDITNVSLVLTDPPYPKTELHLWDDLGLWARDALADDGVLVAYSGQMFLPKVLGMLSVHLDYWWCGCVVHKGSGNLTPLGSPARKVINGWKPLVMFIKRGGAGFDRTFRDVVDGTGPSKENHNWEQPQKEAASIIEMFTKPGDLVVDPFAGSGGFCKAAIDLGRKAIGAEILA